MTSARRHPAFSAYGIELEYALVDATDLGTQAAAAQALGMLADTIPAQPGLEWSNELVAHVIELKNAQPVSDLESLARGFQAEVKKANSLFAASGIRLMPSGMHPWMNPERETVLWTGKQQEIYRTYDRIFDCRRHGWANIQSMHINLPFNGDREFARLHAAVRLLLPLLPALAASSPFADGRNTGFLDYRLEVYGNNASQFPAIARVIPPTVTSRASYERFLLEPMYRQIAPYDPEKLLHHEWLNSHGAIARFDRSAIEIRLADTQECPQMDVAVAAAVIAVARALYQQKWSTLAHQQNISQLRLQSLLKETIVSGPAAEVDDLQYLHALGLRQERCTAGELWGHLIDSVPDEAAWWRPALMHILEQGTLAQRLLKAQEISAEEGEEGSASLNAVYARLCDCLESGTAFAAEPCAGAQRLPDRAAATQPALTRQL